MLAIARACASGELIAVVVTVIAPNEDSTAVASAQMEGLRVSVVPPGEDYGARLLEALAVSEADWICLAGYMRLLPEEVLEKFPRRVLNIHPALLPKHGGKGMYGRRVHEAVIEARDPHEREDREEPRVPADDHGEVAEHRQREGDVHLLDRGEGVEDGATCCAVAC